MSHDAKDKKMQKQISNTEHGLHNIHENEKKLWAKIEHLTKNVNTNMKNLRELKPKVKRATEFVNLEKNTEEHRNLMHAERKGKLREGSTLKKAIEEKITPDVRKIVKISYRYPIGEEMNDIEVKVSDQVLSHIITYLYFETSSHYKLQTRFREHFDSGVSADGHMLIIAVAHKRHVKYIDGERQDMTETSIINTIPEWDENKYYVWLPKEHKKKEKAKTGKEKDMKPSMPSPGSQPPLQPHDGEGARFNRTSRRMRRQASNWLAS